MKACSCSRHRSRWPDWIYALLFRIASGEMFEQGPTGHPAIAEVPVEGPQKALRAS